MILIISISGFYVRAQGGDVLFTQGPGLNVPVLRRAQFSTLIDTHALGPGLSSERTASEWILHFR